MSFYKDQKFYQHIKDAYVAPCPQGPLFKERFRNANVDLSCRCLEQDRGYCSNCKTRCFTLDCLGNKIKIAGLFEIPNDIKVKTIKEYLEMI